MRKGIKKVTSIVLVMVMISALFANSLVVNAAIGDVPNQISQSISISGNKITVRMNYIINGGDEAYNLYFWSTLPGGSGLYKFWPIGNGTNAQLALRMTPESKHSYYDNYHPDSSDGWHSQAEGDDFTKAHRDANWNWLDLRWLIHTQYTFTYELTKDFPGGRYVLRTGLENKYGSTKFIAPASTGDDGNNGRLDSLKGITNFDYVADIANATVTVDPSAFTYNNQKQTPAVSVQYGPLTLQENVDYTIALSSDSTNSGEKTVAITGIGNYKGTITKAYNINKADIKDATVTGINPAYEYTGSPITPEPTVTQHGKTLQFGTDYDVSYENNINAGDATYTITGKGTNYTGTILGSFKIYPYQIKENEITIPKQEYTGNKLTPQPVVIVGKKTLREGVDYTLSYPPTGNVNAGINTGSLNVHGIGNYAVTAVLKPFDIFYLLGDVDLDGEVSIKDATMIQKYIAGIISLNAEQLKVADVDGDNEVSIKDVTIIQKYIAKIITEFPASAT